MRHRYSLLLLFLFVVLSVRAAEEVCGTCDKKVLLTGEFRHGNRDNAVIQGALGREAAFREEIRGANFSLNVLNLGAGKYTAEFGVVELYFDAPGLRLFNVTCGSQSIATDVDIFAAAGGASTVYRFRGEVETAGEAVQGPLVFNFKAIKDNAKFNTFELRNASGVVLISLKAADLIPDEGAGVPPPVVTGPLLWRDPAQPLPVRIKDLLSRMSVPEKAAQMRNGAPGIPRLGLPAYNFWNECLHGVGRAGIATVFPQAIGLAAAWDVPLMRDVADAIATEARAKHHQYARENNGDSAKYYGLTFWTPNINIFRDPRWGRGQETYGEDPFLTSRLGVAFIRGLQGDDPKYIKAMACAKHFAVHSGPEPSRHTFDVAASEQDFYDTYLPHFEAAVREGKVGAFMGAYNRVYGEPACSSKLLLTDLLRNQWGFQGHVVSDCGAIYDIFANHKVVATSEEAAARAVKAGCDLCCGGDYNSLTRAFNNSLITEAEMDVSLGRLLDARFRLGLFDPPEMVPYSKVPFSENDSAAHHALALRIARESMVLLKNNGLLPLDRGKLKRIAVIGTNAISVPVLLGNYNGIPSNPITILDGIKALVGTNIEVLFEQGCPLALRRDGRNKPASETIEAALNAAKSADVVLYVGGLNAQLEGEEMRVDYDGFAGGDRTTIELPAVQTEFLKQLQATGKPIVFVNCSGSAVAMPWEAETLPAILQTWYPGGEGGRAVAETLFGDANPSGRLPVTFYRSTADLPPFDDYSMTNRTHRFFSGKPLFAFGHGLSYTRFEYGQATLDKRTAGPNDTVKLSFDLRNTGARDGDEVVQVYFSHGKQWGQGLCAFSRVSVPHGKSQPVTLEIPANRLRHWDISKKQYIVDPGEYELMVSAASDDIRAKVSLRIAK